MKTLVTGGSGFLGKYLVEQLVNQRGAETLATIGLEPVRPDVRHFPCNLEQEGPTREAVKAFRPDSIFHLAGFSRVSSEIPFEDYFSRNYLTTVHLVRAMQPIDRPISFFFASSVHVYGNAQGIVSEATAPAPESAYGHSKMLAEQFLRDTTIQQKNFRAVVGRLYSCIGPGQAKGFVAADLCAKIVAAKKNPKAPLRTGPLSPYRRFQDGRDVVGILIRLMETPGAPFEIFNVASPHELQIKELLDMLLKEAGISPPIESEEMSGTNVFKGLQIDTSKLSRIVANSEFRPVKETLRDMLKWEQSRPH